MTISACLLYGVTAPVNADEVPGSESVTVGMGNFEPYFIADGEAGIFTDIVRAVFREIPDLHPHFVFGHSNHGLWASFSAGRLEAVANVFDSVQLDGCRSDPVFRFHDVAVSLRSEKIEIENIGELQGYSIVTFEGAQGFFGPEFSENIILEDYLEVPKPELQARMLYGKRYQISVGDLFIFLDAVSKLQAIKVDPSDVVIHDIFPEIETRMAFKDEALCSAFNDALAVVKASGEYDQIYQKYLAKLDYQ